MSLRDFLRTYRKRLYTTGRTVPYGTCLLKDMFLIAVWHLHYIRTVCTVPCTVLYCTVNVYSCLQQYEITPIYQNTAIATCCRYVSTDRSLSAVVDCPISFLIDLTKEDRDKPHRLGTNWSAVKGVWASGLIKNLYIYTLQGSLLTARLSRPHLELTSSFRARISHGWP